MSILAILRGVNQDYKILNPKVTLGRSTNSTIDQNNNPANSSLDD